MPTSGSSQSSDPHVLVVDDVEALADLYGTWLADRYRTTIVYSGAAALETIDRDVDVVLLDRRMPETPGEEVLEAIKARGLECQVALLTAVEPTVDLVDMPFDCYLQKPVDRATLVDVVDRLLTRPVSDTGVRELYALLETAALLRTELRPEELDRNQDYARLQGLIAAKREALGSRAADLETSEYQHLGVLAADDD